MGEWTYGKILQVPKEKIPGGMPAYVLVAYKPLETIHTDGPLNQIYGWIRMVVWLPRAGHPIAHANISTKALDDLVRARLQGFDDGNSIYLVDYERVESGGVGTSQAYETRSGDAPWEGRVVTPRILLDEDRRVRRERAGL